MATPEAFDLIVIGSGTAAQVASARVRAAGWTVAVVDHRPFGGTCALRGCDPKKVLVSGAEAVDAARRMQGHGVDGALRITWPELIRFKRGFTDPVPEKQEQRYAERGIETFHGLARFADPETIAVADRTLMGRYVLLATGARPAPLRIPGEEHAITSNRFMELESLPARIALIGGGYIAAEFSHIAARASARVTVLQREPRMLPQFDPGLVGWLMEKFEELGIDVRTNTTVKGIETVSDGFLVQAAAGDRPQEVPADLVVHAAGRIPDLEPLNLSAAGVSLERGKLKLNPFLQCVDNPRIYAAGDAASNGPPLTPIASHDAKVVAANLLEGNGHRPDYRGVPSVAFTVPPIAMVGLNEHQARERGHKFTVKSGNVPTWFTARRMAERVYGYKVLVDDESDRILGAHLVGPHVEEAINVFALAIRHGLTAGALKATIFAYPTGASDIASMI
jgi:glutathione reductase (NADPH)